MMKAVLPSFLHRVRRFAHGVLMIALAGCATDASSSGSEGSGGGEPPVVGTPGVNTNPGFVDLSPPFGAPLDPASPSPVTPSPPAGWLWFDIEGAMCRDGSPTGLYARFTDSNKLLIFLEGGGACTSPGFCAYNPANVNEVLSGDGQTALTSVGGAVAGRQQPGSDGIFNFSHPDNPFGSWNVVYIPYCTGDVYFGNRANVTVPGMSESQQFVGHLNMKRYASRLVPTFGSRVNEVVLAGSSAGGFGAGLNASLFQDAFGSVLVRVLLDSSAPFSDPYMPPCMQQRWRDLWGMNDSLPPDCTECFNPDGGGILNLADFLVRKHGNATLALVSSTEDEIMRLFFTMGKDNCANFQNADPVTDFVAGIVPPEQYTGGLMDLRARFETTGRFATYLMGGLNAPFHQHLWRSRFYEPAAGGESIAQFIARFLAGDNAQVGP
jgi:hypothetical protein